MNDIMDEYKKLVEFLGIILGNSCEIALQDTRKGMNCITAIVNGHISGRKIGSPLTDLATKIISEGIWEDRDFYVNYTGITVDNKTLRSSTFFIKKNGKLLGMLCFNIDDSKYIDVCKMILNIGGIPLNLNELIQNNNLTSESENFYKDTSDITNNVIDEFFQTRQAVALDRLTQDEKLSIIKSLDEKGVFMVKGSVSKVAKKLYISDASLYRYLSIIKKNSDNTN